MRHLPSLARLRLTALTMLFILFTGTLAACRTGIRPDTVDTISHASPSHAINGTLVSTQSVDIDSTQNDALKRNAAYLENVIYFDYDNYSVKSTYQPLLKQYAQQLKQHPDRKLRIQGHSDERGTREYNLALGQKRAEAVRHAFLLLGVSDSQLEAISLGKEKPLASGHDESSWMQNRCALLIYTQ